MKILLTGFEPFGADRENASEQTLARVLAAHRVDAIPSVELVGEVLPVVFEPDALEAAVQRHRPDALILLGEAGGRTDICVERVARNWIDARIPDGHLNQPRGVPIIAEHGGEEKNNHGGGLAVSGVSNVAAKPSCVEDTASMPTYRTATLDPQLLVTAMREAGWEARVSDDAGLYVCNYTAFLAYGMHIPAVFVHVPALRSGDEPATVGAETDVDIVGGLPASCEPPAQREAYPQTLDHLAQAIMFVLRYVAQLNTSESGRSPRFC